MSISLPDLMADALKRIEKSCNNLECSSFLTLKFQFFEREIVLSINWEAALNT